MQNDFVPPPVSCSECGTDCRSHTHPSLWCLYMYRYTPHGKDVLRLCIVCGTAPFVEQMRGSGFQTFSVTDQRPRP